MIIHLKFNIYSCMSRCARCSDDVILGPPARAWCGGVVGHLDRHRRTLIVRHYDTTGVEVDGGTEGRTEGGCLAVPRRYRRVESTLASCDVRTCSCPVDEAQSRQREVADKLGSSQF